MNPDQAEAPIEKADGEQSGLITRMERLQAKYGYLPLEVLMSLAT